MRDRTADLPIVVITARTNEDNRVEVLELGADDVVAKPFSMRELVARVTVAHRRALCSRADIRGQTITEGDLTIDPERRALSMSGQPIVLTAREFELLWTLVEHPGEVLSRDAIYQRVWRRSRRHGNRSVDVLVRRLRRKVDEAGGDFTYIQTRHGMGYRFEPVLRRRRGQ